MSVGKRVEAERSDGNVIIQTPAFTSTTDFNIFDEFQNLSFASVGYFKDRKNYQNLILASATPFVAMYAALSAQINFVEVRMSGIRKRNSYFIHHNINFHHQKIPDGTIMFSSAEPEALKEDSPKYMTLTQFYDNVNRKALVMHPNAGAGVNPDMNYKIGIMSYSSTIFTGTT